MTVGLRQAGLRRCAAACAKKSPMRACCQGQTLLPLPPREAVQVRFRAQRAGTRVRGVAEADRREQGQATWLAGEGFRGLFPWLSSPEARVRPVLPARHWRTRRTHVPQTWSSGNASRIGSTCSREPCGTCEVLRLAFGLLLGASGHYLDKAGQVRTEAGQKQQTARELVGVR